MKILIAIDGSECSDKAVEEAVRMSWAEDAEFLLYTVVPPMEHHFATTDTLYMPDLPRLMEESRAQALTLIDKQLTHVRSVAPTLKITGEVAEGPTRKLILEKAAQWGADLIVMGSHGRSGLQRFLLGSIAESIAGMAPCSVHIARGSFKPTEPAQGQALAAAQQSSQQHRGQGG